jgi:hypothetical protein
VFLAALSASALTGCESPSEPRAHADFVHADVEQSMSPRLRGPQIAPAARVATEDEDESAAPLQKGDER